MIDSKTSEVQSLDGSNNIPSIDEIVQSNQEVVTDSSHSVIPNSDNNSISNISDTTPSVVVESTPVIVQPLDSSSNIPSIDEVVQSNQEVVTDSSHSVIPNLGNSNFGASVSDTTSSVVVESTPSIVQPLDNSSNIPSIDEVVQSNQEVVTDSSHSVIPNLGNSNSGASIGDTISENVDIEKNSIDVQPNNSVILDQSNNDTFYHDNSANLPNIDEVLNVNNTTNIPLPNSNIIQTQNNINNNQSNGMFVQNTTYSVPKSKNNPSIVVPKNQPNQNMSSREYYKTNNPKTHIIIAIFVIILLIVCGIIFGPGILEDYKEYQQYVKDVLASNKANQDEATKDKTEEVSKEENKDTSKDESKQPAKDTTTSTSTTVTWNGVYKNNERSIKIFKDSTNTIIYNGNNYPYEIFMGNAKISGNKTISDDVIFTLNGDNLTISSTDEDDFFTGTYTRISDYTKYDYYSDNIGDTKYIDSQYNGVYKSAEGTIEMYQTYSDVVNVWINNGRVLGDHFKIIDGKLVYENEDSTDIEGKLILEIIDNTLIVTAEGDDEFLNSFVGTYKFSKKLSFDEILSIAF